MTHLSTLRWTLLLAVGACTTTITEPPVAKDPCDGPAILGPDGQATGFVRCDDGVVVRPQRRTGVQTLIAGKTCSLQDQQCSDDSECSDGTHGRCLEQASPWGDEPFCGCSYSCADDSECGAGQICLPPGVFEQGPAWGTCIQAACATNEDCASGECSFTAFDDGCGWHAQLSCRAATDSCRVDADCALPNHSCALGYDGLFQCRTQDCDIGRPLTTQEGWCTAPIEHRDDWHTAHITPSAHHADLHGHWCRIAALEHASVASFARHTLELMSLGAPPDLLAEVQAAARDEIVHAQLIFGLASSVGPTVGPGPLPLHDVHPRTTAAQTFRALLLEGCIGETLGAAEARLSASQAGPDLAPVLDRIADDETRHAALAWKTARWMIATWPELVDVVRDVAVSERAPIVYNTDPDHVLTEFGALSNGARAELHGRAWRDVMDPVLHALTVKPAAERSTVPPVQVSLG